MTERIEKMSIAANEKEIIEDFELFSDWEDKYEYIISLGKELPLIKDEYKTEDYLVRGCQSRVWLHAEKQGENIVFTADSDAIITKGIIALLVRVLSNQPAAEVAKSELDFINKIGLKDHLSPNRSNGLVSMIQKMKTYALAYSQGG
jgi:cysteine desulfuration protein SufE